VTISPDPPRGARASVGQKLALALAGVLGTLVLLEIAVRIIWIDPVTRVLQQAAGQRPPASAAAIGDRQPVKHFFDLAKPNVRVLYKGVPYDTDRLGFRGPDLSPEPAEGVFRIAVTGDSVAVGSGVLLEESYPARLAALLSERSPSTRYEVVNTGFAGVNAAGAMERLAKAVSAYHPDLLVYGFTVNDIEGPHYDERPPTRDWAQSWLTWAQGSPPSFLLRLLAPYLEGVYETLFRPGAPLLEFNYFENEAAWRDFTRALDELAEMARREGICAHLLVFTQLSRLDQSHRFLRIYAHVAEAARERGITVTQSFPAFEGRDGKSLWLNPLDSHPNAEGHEILAQVLLAGLQELPPSCLGAPAKP
jgi:lysophospholipase L1-like esterase